MAEQYYPFDEQKRNLLKKEIAKVQEMIKKLEPFLLAWPYEKSGKICWTC